MLKEYKRLLPLIRRYRWYYVFGVLSLLVTSGGQLLLPQFVSRAIDLLVAGGTSAARIGGIMLGMVGIALVIAVARWGWRYFIHGASRRIESELRRDLYHHLVTLSPAYFNQTKTGELMARFTNDMHAIRMAVGMALVAFIDGVFMTIAILAILIAQNPRLAAVTVIPLPIITILIISLGSTVGKLFRGVQEGFAAMSDQAQEVMSGIRVVKSFVKESYFVNRFADANAAYQRKNMRLVRLWGVFFPVVGFLSGMTLLILLLFGGTALIRGALSAGEFVATLSYLQMLTWPMLGAGMTVNMLQRGAASMGRINELLSTRPTITSPPDGRREAGPGRIDVHDLHFRYPDTTFDSLSGVSFTVEPGQLVGILGYTGSGKSTLVHALLRLIDTPAGTVYVDGTDVCSYDLDTLRALFGMVPQSTFLFSATIEQNVAFGMPQASSEQVRTIGALAAIDMDMGEFPHGWETVVGERGVTLSGGQKQRLTLARALLVDPTVLILDDSLSAVDTKTEERILRRMLAERAGRTTVCVTNRVSTIQSADIILVMENGRIIQRGTHTDLVTEPGLYGEIFRLQQQERAKEHL